MQFQGKETAVCGRSSSGRAPPCQGGGSEFEPRRPLQTNSKEPVYAGFLLIMVTWPSGKARVCKTLIRQFKSARHLHKPMTKKMSQAFFFAVSSKIGSFTTQFWDAVLQCCQTILGRFPQLDAHFPCRFLEFGRRRGNFFEKNRINPAVFRMFQFPRSQFPIGCGVFSFFAVAGKMGIARTFIPFPIMRMCGGFSNRTSSMRRLQISDTRAAVSYNTHNP